MRKFEDSLLEIVQLRGGYEILNNKQKTLEIYENLNPGSDKLAWIREAFDCDAIPYMMREVEKGSANYAVIKKRIFKLLSDCRSDTVRNGRVMICMFRAVGWDDTAGEVQKGMATGKKIVPIVTAAIVCVVAGCVFLFGKPILQWAGDVVNTYENGKNAEKTASNEGQAISDQQSASQQAVSSQNSSMQNASANTSTNTSGQNTSSQSVAANEQVQQQNTVDMSGVTELNWHGIGLSDTSGVRGYNNLVTLDLGENEISDLSDLSSLTSLNTLTIYHNPISDLSPLSGISSLIEVNVGEAPVNDLSPLSSLYNLNVLDVWYTNVSDLTPISGLTSLKRLYLSHSLVTSLDPIVNLPNISVLSISGLTITDGSLDRFIQTHPNCTIYNQTRSEELGNPEAYLMPQSDVYPLSKTFLKDYSTYDLWIAKNEIFARRGRKFKDNDLQTYFNGKKWYHGTIAPDDFNPDTMLNDAEKANVDLLIELGADTYQK